MGKVNIFVLVFYIMTEDLAKEIEAIELEIKRIVEECFVKYPEGATEDVKNAIDYYNESVWGAYLAELESRKRELEERLKSGD